MDVGAELGQAGVGVGEVLLEPARMRRGEADAGDALDGVDLLDQLHKGRDAVGMGVVATTIRGDDLAEEGDLAHAARGEGFALGDDLLHGAGAFVAAGLGDDAEGAVHVAALLNGDEGGDLRRGAGVGRGVGAGAGQEVVLDGVLRAGLLLDVHDAGADGQAGLAGGADVVEIAGDLVKFLGADDEIDVGQAFEDFGAAVLGHAAEDTEDEVGVLLFAVGDVGGFAEGLLLGGVAHGAGVEEHDVAVVLILHDAVAATAQHGRDRLAVAFVHLATIGLDIDAVHLGKRGGKQAGGARGNGESLRGGRRGVEAGQTTGSGRGPGSGGARCSYYEHGSGREVGLCAEGGCVALAACERRRHGG